MWSLGFRTLFELLLVLSFVNSSRCSEKHSKSLFDDLPLNGAYIPSHLKTRMLEEPINIGRNLPDSAVSLNINLLRTKIVPSDISDLRSDGRGSLFNLLPDQGALPPSSVPLPNRHLMDQPDFVNSPNTEGQIFNEFGNQLTEASTNIERIPNVDWNNEPRNLMSMSPRTQNAIPVNVKHEVGQPYQLSGLPSAVYYEGPPVPVPLPAKPNRPRTHPGQGQNLARKPMARIDPPMSIRRPQAQPPLPRPIILKAIPKIQTPPSSQSQDPSKEFNSRTLSLNLIRQNQDHDQPSGQPVSFHTSGKYFEDHVDLPPLSYAPLPPNKNYGPPPPTEHLPPPQLPLTHPEPQPSYGPPLPPIGPPAPPPPRPQRPQRPSSSTSISYQTIPIQTVQTQLVTVPHLTVSSSSGSGTESELENDQPQNPKPIYGPPSGGYGYGSNLKSGSDGFQPKEQTRNEALNSNPSASPALFTDDQVAALLTFSGLGLDGAAAGGSSSLGLGLSTLPGEDEAVASLLLGGVGSRAQNGDNLFGFRNNPFLRPRGHGYPDLGGNLNLPVIGPVRSPGQDFLGYSSLLNTPRFPGAGLVPFGSERPGVTLTRDGADALSDLIREQRLQGAVNTLRGQLRAGDLGRLRARQSYRSLFYKGALLIGALSLLPTIAGPVASPGGYAAANSKSYLLPLAVGRRKREVNVDELQDKLVLEFIYQSCNETSAKNRSQTSLSTAGNNSTDNARFKSWLDCVSKLTDLILGQSLENGVRVGGSTTSIFDTMPFKGAFVPERIRPELVKYFSPEEILRNSECIQKEFCSNIVQVTSLPNAETFLFLYAVFASDVDRNPWIRYSMTAARNNKCSAFYCHSDFDQGNDK